MRRFFRFILSLIRLSVLMVIFFTLLGIGMAVGGYLLLDYTITGEEVEVPMLYNKTKTQAMEILNAHELLLDTENIIEKETNEFPPGVVISQKPFPGFPVKKGRKIQITVSVRGENSGSGTGGEGMNGRSSLN